MEPRRHAVLFFFAALALFPMLAAVSSSEALAALGACIQQNNAQLQPMGGTFQLQGNGYYMFDYPLSSPNRMLAAVQEQDGLLVRDSGVLNALGKGVYNDLVLRDSIKAKGFSADALQTAVQSSQPLLDDEYAKVQVFVSQTNDKYPKLNFRDLQTRLDALRASADQLNTQLSNTVSEEQQYFNAPSAEGSGTVIQQYNASFTALFAFLDAYDAYSKSITDVERQLYEQSVPDPDNKNINTNLENLRNIGISNLYAKAKAADPRKSLAARLAQGERWVNDSVDSFEFQDLSCRAEGAYQDAFPKYDGIVKSQALLTSVGLGLDVKNVKNDWSVIEKDHQKRTAESYQELLDKEPGVKAEMDALQTRYNALTAPTPAPSKPTPPSDPTNWIILILVLSLGGYGVWLYRKKQQDENGELGDSEHH